MRFVQGENAIRRIIDVVHLKQMSCCYRWLYVGPASTTTVRGPTPLSYNVLVYPAAYKQAKQVGAL